MDRAPVTVLVVEDNDADAQLVVEGLTEASVSARAHVVTDGREALEWLRAHDVSAGARLPDLVLLDLNLPRCNGLETLAELKADSELRRIPVIVLTTSKSSREINGSYELGAAAVLNKPMRLADHRAMMHALASFWLAHVHLPHEGQW
jgi:two-component system, chemotaxis family, response regulator Rcp1